MFVTFDNYYEIDEYNEFIQAAKNNNIQFTEYISIRAPYNWYVKVDTLPQFVNYEVSTPKDDKWLVSKMLARYPNEEYLLQRRIGNNVIEKYISPEPLIRARTAQYWMIFKSGGHTELMKISENIESEKLYVLGKARGYFLILTFNKYFQSFIHKNFILLEKETTGQYGNPGEIEQALNYKILVKEKLENKTMELPYYQGGKYYPLKRLSTI